MNSNIKKVFNFTGMLIIVLLIFLFIFSFPHTEQGCSKYIWLLNPKASNHIDSLQIGTQKIPICLLEKMNKIYDQSITISYYNKKYYIDIYDLHLNNNITTLPLLTKDTLNKFKGKTSHWIKKISNSLSEVSPTLIRLGLWNKFNSPLNLIIDKNSTIKFKYIHDHTAIYKGKFHKMILLSNKKPELVFDFNGKKNQEAFIVIHVQLPKRLYIIIITSNKKMNDLEYLNILNKNKLFVNAK